jgi:hypothetical protein
MVAFINAVVHFSPQAKSLASVNCLMRGFWEEPGRMNGFATLESCKFGSQEDLQVQASHSSCNTLLMKEQSCSRKHIGGLPQRNYIFAIGHCCMVFCCSYEDTDDLLHAHSGHHI